MKKLVIEYACLASSEQIILFKSLDTIQYNTIQYNTIQYNTIQYNTIQYNKISLIFNIEQN